MTRALKSSLGDSVYVVKAVFEPPHSKKGEEPRCKIGIWGTRGERRSSAKFWEGLLEVGNEVGGGFEADVEADDAVIVGRPAGNSADVVGDGETCYTCPAVTHLEKIQSVNEGENLLLRGAGFKHQ